MRRDGRKEGEKRHFCVHGRARGKCRYHRVFQGLENNRPTMAERCTEKHVNMGWSTSKEILMLAVRSTDHRIQKIQYKDGRPSNTQDNTGWPQKAQDKIKWQGNAQEFIETSAAANQSTNHTTRFFYVCRKTYVEQGILQWQKPPVQERQAKQHS